MVLVWYTGEVEKSDIRLLNSLHLSKQVSNLFNNWLGRDGVHKVSKVFIAENQGNNKLMFKGGPINS